MVCYPSIFMIPQVSLDASSCGNLPMHEYLPFFLSSSLQSTVITFAPFDQLQGVLVQAQHLLPHFKFEGVMAGSYGSHSPLLVRLISGGFSYRAYHFGQPELLLSFWVGFPGTEFWWSVEALELNINSSENLYFLPGFSWSIPGAAFSWVINRTLIVYSVFLTTFGDFWFNLLHVEASWSTPVKIRLVEWSFCLEQEKQFLTAETRWCILLCSPIFPFLIPLSSDHLLPSQGGVFVYKWLPPKWIILHCLLMGQRKGVAWG